MSVCHAPSNCFFGEIEPFFWPSVFHVALYKTLFLYFRFVAMATKFGLFLPKKSILLIPFCFSMESSHFWPLVLHDPLYKTLFFDFLFRPPNAQNLLPKICTKSPITRLVWQIDRRCLGLPGGFRGWPIQWNHAEYRGAALCCHGNEIWARRRDPVAYRLVVIFCQ